MGYIGRSVWVGAVGWTSVTVQRVWIIAHFLCELRGQTKHKYDGYAWRIDHSR